MTTSANSPCILLGERALGLNGRGMPGEVDVDEATGWCLGSYRLKTGYDVVVSSQMFLVFGWARIIRV